MTEKVEGIEVGRGKIDGLALNIEGMAMVLSHLFKLDFQRTVGTTGEGVYKVIMILNRSSFPIESGMMFNLITYLNSLLFVDSTVCLSPFAEEIDVDVSTGAQFGLGVVETEAMSLEEHHGDVVLGIKAGQACHCLFMLMIEFPLMIGHPQKLQTGDIQVPSI